MDQKLRIILIWILLLSPVWVGALIVQVRPERRDDLGMMFGQAVGVAAIGVIGLVVSILTRKMNSADKLSIAGYAVPAVLVCGYQLFRVLA